jgi:RsiW-degrading membrane proteinase PrsW (M82 family)
MMSIHVTCSCGEQYHANEALAGRTMPCAACGQPLRIPDPDNDPPGTPPPPAALPRPTPPAPPLTRDDHAGSNNIPTSSSALANNAPTQQPSTNHLRTWPPAPEVVSVPDPLPETDQGRPAAYPTAAAAPATKDAWLRRHFHWLLVLTLIPLALPWYDEDSQPLRDRLQETISTMPAEEGVVAKMALERSEGSVGSIESVFRHLPENRCTGAFLPRQTWLHWVFAAASVALFALFLLQGADGPDQTRRLFEMALWAAFLGGVFLLFAGLATQWSKDLDLRHNAYSLLTVPIMDLFTYGYRGAANPENNFWGCLTAFTLAIALSEEVLKALPLLIWFRRPRQQPWRQSFLWGLTCGAAFGIIDALVQSRQFFNGVRGPESYLIAFLPSVALQAVWTGTVALAIHRRQARLHDTWSIGEYLLLLLWFLAPAVVLHGFYTTLLERGSQYAALGAGAASFLLLAWQLWATQRAEATEAPASAAAA